MNQNCKYICENILDGIEVDEVEDNVIPAMNPDDYDFYFKLTMDEQIITFKQDKANKYFKLLDSINDVIEYTLSICDHSIVCGFYKNNEYGFHEYVEDDFLRIYPPNNQSLLDRGNRSGIHFSISLSSFTRMELLSFLKRLLTCLFTYADKNIVTFSKLFTYLHIYKNLGNKQFQCCFASNNFFPNLLSILIAEKNKDAEYESIIGDLTKLFNLFIPNEDFKNYSFIINQTKIDDLKFFKHNIIYELQFSKVVTNFGFSKKSINVAYTFHRREINLWNNIKEFFIGKSFQFDTNPNTNKLYTALLPINSFGYASIENPESPITRNILKSLINEDTKIKRFAIDSVTIKETNMMNRHEPAETITTFATFYLDYGFVKYKSSIDRCFVIYVLDADPNKRNKSIAEAYNTFPDMNTNMIDSILNMAWKLKKK